MVINMMNIVWPLMMIIAFISAIFTGNMQSLSSSITESAAKAVDLCVTLLAVMTFWGGIMQIMEKSGFNRVLSKFLMPILKLIFPGLKNEEDTLSVMSMNVTANLLGLGNAATPLGLESMKKLQALNDDKTSASAEMILFVVMNTASMRLIPTTIASIRQQYGSENPMSILPASILTSFCALLIGIFAVKIGNYLFLRKNENTSLKLRRVRNER